MLNCVQSIVVVDDGSNLSDHLPVSMSCELTPTMVSFNTSASALPEHAVHSYCLRWDKADVLSYFNRSYDLLSNIDVTCLDNGPAGIKYCYQAIVTSLHMAASNTVPYKRQSYYKFWWDSELDKLKEMSMDAHTIWKQAGKPKYGPIYEAKRISHANYKLAVKRKKRVQPRHIYE